ncbi:PKD domain-containing protein [Dokdonella fugitiva]|uniref:PKD domain-containing protein n=1 Tax=Dokdonella fugitiva TaxID=328517 RepID=A0A4R2IC47_9GAMM|nr:PKD domain-containing protein [Dokdonella fugitiva]MBA8885016.1 PKD repeat protein [Dokdonella fugitiva]TCO42114.1 PKD domain-containing protein [Dokdonella fugitiva]
MNFETGPRRGLLAAATLVMLGGLAPSVASASSYTRLPPELQPNAVVNAHGQTVVYGTSYQSDTSLPLYYLPEWKGSVSERSSDEREAAENWRIPGRHIDGKDPIVQNIGNLTAAAMPAPIISFDGMGVGSCGCAPPDPNGEVGRTQYVQMTNAGYQVFDKVTGASLLGPRATSSIWAGFGGVCETSGHGDPIVLYDQIADRWVITQFAGGSTITDECIAVSTSSDATGSYKRYGYHLGSEFYDYPHLGVWPDGYYMSMNVFNAAGTAYLRPQPFAFDRAAMIAGATSAAYVTTTSLGSGNAPLMPADLDGSTLPPTGAPGVFVEYPDTNTYKTYRFHADFVTPSNTTFTLAGSPSAAAFTQPCGSNAKCVPTKGGSSNYLNGLDDRLMFRLAYRNFGDHESLVGNYTVKANNVAGIRWFELRNVTSGTPTKYQESTYQPDSTWRWMGSAAMDRQGNLALAYSASSSSINPQIRYAGRLAGDALNTITQTETHLFDGGGSQTGSGNRWGDYSDLTVDPVDDCTFWYTQEYYASNSSFNWRTRIGSFKFAGCGGGGGNVPPVANFGVSTNGLTANFTDSSTDSDGTIASRAWNFGDGGTSTATNPSHTYASAGTYSVSLTVTDNGGATNTKTTSVPVSSPTNTPPVANFSFTTSGLTANFTDSSTDSDGTIASRSWSFGDGGTSTATNPSHTYASAGTYSVSLTVTDNGGAGNTKTSSVTVSSSGNVLQNGVPVTGLSATTGNTTAVYTMTVPAGATNLVFATSGSNGDADLYVRFGSAPTTSSYDCRPYTGSSSETCSFPSPQAGTYYVMVRAYSSFTGLSLTGSYSTGGGGGTVLTSGVPVTSVSAGLHAYSTTYTIVVPSGRTNLTVTTSGGSGDGDLYVRRGAAPTTSTYTCRSWASGNTESCSINSPVADTYYIRIYGYTAASGITLKATYTP